MQLKPATAAVVASSDDQQWHLAFVTANVVADAPMGVPVKLGQWVGVETDFDATTGLLHGLLTDKASGMTLADMTLNAADFGKYDPKADGVFNIEAFTSGDISLINSQDPSLTHPDLAVIDNIDSFNNQHRGNAFGFGHDHDINTRLMDCISSDRG